MKLSIVFFLLPLLAAAQDGEIPTLAATDTSELMAQEGQKVRVTGFIGSTGKSPTGIHFLNFAGSEFQCVTFAREVSAFPDGAPADVFEGKQVAVVGELQVYRGSPQIRLESPDQIKITADSPPEKAPEPEPTETMETPEPPVEPAEPAPEPEPDTAPESDDGLEVVDGVPAIDWRKYFPE